MDDEFSRLYCKNMIPKQAIEKAIEGGYHDFPFLLMTPPYDKVYLEGEKIVAKKNKDGWDSTANAFLKDLNYYKIALDPTFWQSLGKTLDWCDHNQTSRQDGECLRCGIPGTSQKPTWYWQSSKFCTSSSQGNRQSNTGKSY